MTADPAAQPLSRPERIGLALLALFVVAFGGLTVLRSAFQQERKTDFGVYARAGYAVRAGLDPYDKAVCDDRGWHYCYPPTFAVLMAPLADPFQFDYDKVSGYLPFWASVVVWYALSVLFVAFAAHTFLKAALPDAVPGTRRWWYARLLPVYVCLGGICYTLSRGQVNLLLLALVAGMFAASVRGRWLTAGVWLAGAVALKVIPGFLALYPAVVQLRGPGGVAGLARTALGTVLGLIMLLGAIPAAVWGLDGAAAMNRKMIDVVIAPGATGEGDQTRAKELTSAISTDNQAFQAAYHNWQHPTRSQRPSEYSPLTRTAHWATGGLMVLVTLVAGWRRLGPTPADRLILLGCLTVVMILIAPVSHMHYYAMVLPLAAGLTAKGLAGRRLWPAPRVLVPLAAWAVLSMVPLLPDDPFLLLRDLGLATFATTGLWAVGVREMTRRSVVVPP